MLTKAMVQAFLGAMPNDGTSTLYSLGAPNSSGNTFDAGTSYTHTWKHHPTKEDRMSSDVIITPETVKITLRDQGESVKPKPGDKIVLGSDTFLISEGGVKNTARGALYDCFCVKV